MVKKTQPNNTNQSWGSWLFRFRRHRSSQGESDTRWHTSLPADSAVQPRQAIWCLIAYPMKSVTTHVIDDEVWDGHGDAERPDECGSHLGPELGVAALEGEHDAAVPVQGHRHQGVDRGVDGQVLQDKSLGIQ